jgi:hypothetical protein
MKLNYLTRRFEIQPERLLKLYSERKAFEDVVK